MGTTTKLARWLTGLGIAISLGAIVLGVGLQMTITHAYTGFNARLRSHIRVDDIVVSLSMFNAGAVLVVLSQIMRLVSTQQPDPTPQGPPQTPVADLSD